MRQSKLSVLRSKLRVISSIARVIFLRVNGMELEDGVKIGKIICAWPGSVTIGSGSIVEDKVLFETAHPFTDSKKIKVGKRTFIGYNSHLHCGHGINIGDDCLIASNTTIVDVGHAFNSDKPINSQEVTSASIVINDDVWIGTGSKILMGVEIGQGSIVAAGSVVVKRIPPYEIWGGVPAKFIRRRFS